MSKVEEVKRGVGIEEHGFNGEVDVKVVLGIAATNNTVETTIDGLEFVVGTD